MELKIGFKTTDEYLFVPGIIPRKLSIDQKDVMVNMNEGWVYKRVIKFERTIPHNFCFEAIVSLHTYYEKTIAAEIFYLSHVNSNEEAMLLKDYRTVIVKSKNKDLLYRIMETIQNYIAIYGLKPYIYIYDLKQDKGEYEKVDVMDTILNEDLLVHKSSRKKNINPTAICPEHALYFPVWKLHSSFYFDDMLGAQVKKTTVLKLIPRTEKYNEALDLIEKIKKINNRAKSINEICTNLLSRFKFEIIEIMVDNEQELLFERMYGLSKENRKNQEDTSKFKEDWKKNSFKNEVITSKKLYLELQMKKNIIYEENNVGIYGLWSVKLVNSQFTPAKLDHLKLGDDEIRFTPSVSSLLQENATDIILYYAFICVGNVNPITTSSESIQFEEINTYDTLYLITDENGKIIEDVTNYEGKMIEQFIVKQNSQILPRYVFHLSRK